MVSSITVIIFQRMQNCVLMFARTSTNLQLPSCSAAEASPTATCVARLREDASQTPEIARDPLFTSRVSCPGLPEP